MVERGKRESVPRVRQLLDLIILLLKWSVALALVAALALGFYLYHRLDEELRAQVELRLGEKYPRLKVTVREAQLVRGEGIRVRGLSIVEPNASGPQEELMFVDELFVHCDTDPRELMQGKLNVARLTFRKPVLRAVRRGDGRWSAAQLLPLPKFGDGLPTGVIEEGVLELVDLTGPSAAKLVLRNSHLTWSVESMPAAAPGAPVAKRLRIAGRAENDHIRKLSIEGNFDPAGSSWSLSGAVGQLDATPEFRATLPLPPDPRLALLSAIRSKAEAQFRVAYTAAEDRTLPGTFEFDVTGRAYDGHLEDPRLPYPVTDLSGKFHINNHGIQISECTARHGPSTLRIDLEKQGLDPLGPLRLQASTQRLTLDPKMLELLPEKLRTQWHNFMPAGEIDLAMALTFDGNTWQPEVAVQCHDVAFTYHKFPYRLERGRGVMKLVGKQLTFDLTTQANTEEVKLVGDLILDGPASYGWTEARATSLRIDERLLRALPDSLTKLAKAMQPRGRTNAFVRLWKDAPGDGPMHRHMIFNLQGCDLRYEKFPYPLADIHGTAEVNDDRFTFHDDLRAVNDTARITCRGQLTPVAEGAELTLLFHGENVPIDEELRDSLNPGSQRLWNDMKPRGLMRLDSEVRYRLRDQTISVWVRGEPVADTVSIEPTYFPYRMDKVHGTFTFCDGRLQMDQLHAEHGRTQIAASGECQIDPQGGWRLRLERLFVDRLAADRDLLHALPDALKKTTGSLAPEGLFNLRGGLTLAGGAQPGQPLEADWDVTFDCHNNALQCGVPLNGIHGSLWLSGKSAGGRFESQGEIKLDSISYGDYQFTEVLGPIWIDNEQVLLGFWADRRRQQQPERRITGKLYGGNVVADGWVVPGDEPEYAFLATLTGGDLARFAGEQLPGAGKLTGEMAATVDLRGKGSSRNGVAGRGSIQLRNADIYQTPAMVSLLKVLSLRNPDAGGFTESDIQFVIQGEHCYLERIDFSGNAISLQGRGELNLVDNRIALVFRTVIGSDARRTPGMRQLLGGASQQILLIHVDGTTTNPQIRREAFPGVNQALEQLQAELQRPLTPRTPTGGVQIAPPQNSPFDQR